MRRSWTPSIVPSSNDQNVYIVVDDFGRNGRAYRETDKLTIEMPILNPSLTLPMLKSQAPQVHLADGPNVATKPADF